MTAEETIQQELLRRFTFLQDQVRVQRVRRVWAAVPRDNFAAVFDTATKDLGFTILCMITGLDEGENLAALYHVAQPSGLVLTLKLAVPKTEPQIRTVTGTFPQAMVMERELVDLLGFQVEGLPPGHRYPLTDDWPAGQYPLRKDWTPEMLKKEAGHA